jgi:phosphoribosyl-ATP pyrophosphohydrolase
MISARCRQPGLAATIGGPRPELRQSDVPMSSFTLADLEAMVAKRAAASPETSYTASLLAKGPAHCAKKFGEEAVETIIAATEGEPKALVAESADALFHLLVVWKSRGIALDTVMAELERRTSQSGHAEKAARKVAPPGTNP